MATLLIPVLLILGLLLSGGPSPEAATNSTKGTLEIAFEAVPTGQGGGVQAVDGSGNIVTAAALAYQRIALNVISVRLNPSTDPNVSDFDHRWVSILVPSGVGQNNTGATITTPFNGFGNFGPSGNAVSIGQGRSELQLDMNAIQNGPEIFNAAKIPARTYNQLELVLDPLTQGTLVPLCASLSPSGEGCVAYPGIYTPAAGQPRTIRVTNLTPIDMKRGSFQTILININLQVQAPPTQSDNPNKSSVAIIPSISVSSNAPGLLGLGTLSGTVKNAGKRQSVVAELSGTNQIIASSPVQKGVYSMSLPALPGGTLYDVYTTGAGIYNVRSGITVSAGQAATLDFTIAASGVTAISGTIADICNNGVKIPSATFELYVPDNNSPNNVTTCAFDNTTGNVSAGCVEVATAQSDATGLFPLPGNTFTRVPFTSVPLKLPSGVSSYYLKVTASGYNGVVEQVVSDGTVLKCKDLKNKNDSCDFVALERGQLSVPITMDSPGNNTGQPLNIMVMAEDSGTHNIEGLGMANIPPGQSTGSVTFNVPDDGTGSPSTSAPCDINTPAKLCTLNQTPTTGAFDLFGQVQDTFFGIPQSATGHSIGVTAGASGSGYCPSSPTTVAALSGFGCAGHGSIAGQIATGDPNSRIVLSQDGVDLMQTNVAPFANNSTTNAFSFCVPGGGTYTVTHEEAPPNATPSPISSVSVFAPTPVATSTAGCGTICSTSSGVCLFCDGTALASPIE